MPRQRRTPRRHTVHPTDPRYNVSHYGRGDGDPAVKHRVKIARDTLKMPDEMVGVMGGMNKEQARSFLSKGGHKLPQIAGDVSGLPDDPRWSWTESESDAQAVRDQLISEGYDRKYLDEFARFLVTTDTGEYGDIYGIKQYTPWLTLPVWSFGAPRVGSMPLPSTPTSGELKKKYSQLIRGSSGFSNLQDTAAMIKSSKMLSSRDREDLEHELHMRMLDYDRP